MPEDVSRSDSQRSDASSRPRVSFNRDVHVKRIGNSGAPRVVGALAGDSAGRLHPLAVRRERPTRLSRRDLALEAKRVLEQADSVTCSSTALGLPAGDNATTKFSTLPVRRKKARVAKPSGSFRESNPRVKEGTSSSSPERIPKRPRIVTRSASDAGDKLQTVKPDEDKTKFWSLDRLRAKKNKVERGRQVQSDTEASASPIASILSKKSHSDTEKRNRKNSDSEASAAKKKQLSPIIEASPRDDYFQSAGGEEADEIPDGRDVITNNKSFMNQANTSNVLMQNKVPRAPSRSRKLKTTNNDNNTNGNINNYHSEPVKMETILHSSQTISKPTLTRGLTVDSMVRKLSQDRAGRGPPRVVSPLGLPGDERKHNNNLPFSYTEPPYQEDRYTSLVTDKHTTAASHGFARNNANEKDDRPTLPPGSSPTAQPTSDALQGDGQVIYAEVVCNGGGKAGGNLTKQTVHTSVAQSRVKEDAAKATRIEEMGIGKLAHDYKTEFKTSLGDYSAEGRGRADGMDARRTMYEEENRRHSPTRRNLMDDFINAENHHGYMDGRVYDDVIEPILKPRSDLSLRRDRLESRIESQRKDRLMSSRLNDKSYRSHQNINESVIDNVRKYPSNPRLDSDYNRREFLDSQINYENGLSRAVVSQDKLHPDDSFGRSVDHLDKYAPRPDGKFTDSGIDIDYRGDAGPLLVNNYQTNEVVNETRRTYHNKYEKKKKPEKIRHNSQPTLTNITKVDTNGHIKPGASDDEDQVDDTPKYYYNSQQNVDQIKAKQAAMNASKISHESKRDTVPQSSVLIRHLAPQDVTTGEGYHRREQYGGNSRKRREFDERRDMDEDCWKSTPSGLGNAEDTRRFLMEERRRMAEERKGDDCWRPEKVLQKWSKMELKAPKKKQGPIDKVKALFSSKKKAVKKVETTSVAPVDQLTSRYTEYKGGGVGEETTSTTSTTPKAPSRSRNSANQSQIESRGRRERLATPSPSPSRPSTALNSNISSNNNSNTGSWFKSLDRLTSRKKPKPIKPEIEITLDETKTYKNNNNVDKSNKNLRFFGDTDAESVRSGGRPLHKPLHAVSSLSTLKENPRYDGSANGNGQRYIPLRENNNRRYKSANKLQVPRRRHHRSAGELATSSAESTTEGDSSQQSQRSVVYLHAATVGDIPGRAPSRTQRRARSREELSSTTGSNLTPQTRTVSRSISVLAPWKPRHYREPMEVHYENDSDLTSRAGKPPKVPTNYKTTSSTLSRIKNNKESSMQKSYNSLNREGRGKDKENLTRKSLNSLHRKDNHKSIDSVRDASGKGSRRDLDSALSYESSKGKRVGNGLNATTVDYRNGSTTLKKTKTDREQKRVDLARSVSMPKDSKVKSGWFRLRKK